MSLIGRKELVEYESLPVPYGIAEEGDPVSEYHYPTIPGEHKVKHDVAMPEDEEVDRFFGVLIEVLAGVLYEVFMLLSQVFAFAVAFAALL